MRALWSRLSVTAAVLAIVLGVALLVLGIVGPGQILAYTKKSVVAGVIVDSTKALLYPLWVNFSAPDMPPMYYTVYMFNLTNPVEYMQGIEKPMMVEIGPYVYQEFEFRFNVTFNENATLRRFKLWEYWVYRPDLSCPGLDPDTDMLYTVNMPLQAVLANIGGGDQWWQQLALDVLASMTNSSLIVHKTPTDLLWGYEEPLFALLSSYGLPLPSSFPGFNQPGNASDTNVADAQLGYCTEWTGKGNLSQAWQVEAWNDTTTLHFWNGTEANELVGTQGEHFAPFLTLKSLTNSSLFVAELYRSIELQCNETSELLGIPLLKCYLWDWQLKNCTQDNRNCGYWATLPTGVFNLSAASFGAPLFPSLPHFTMADPYYLEMVDGLVPNISKYSTTLEVEPWTGTTMRGYKKLQVNVWIKPLLLLYPNARECFMPVFWVDEGGEIDQKVANQWHATIGLSLKAQKISKILGYVAGSVILALSLAALTVLLISIYWRPDHETYTSINDSAEHASLRHLMNE